MIEFNEWVKTLKSCDSAKDGYSAEEIRDKTGLSRPSCAIKLKDAIRNGECEFAGKRKTVNCVGSVQWVPVYRFKNGKSKIKNNV